MIDKAVELVFFSGCPHVDSARRSLERALRQAGASPEWIEWDTLRDDTPAAYRNFPSPTVLVAGRDVMGPTEQTGMACRAHGAPHPKHILAAIARDE